MSYTGSTQEEGMNSKKLKKDLFNKMGERLPVEPHVIAGRMKGKKIYPACHPKGHS